MKQTQELKSLFQSRKYKKLFNRLGFDGCGEVFFEAKLNKKVYRLNAVGEKRGFVVFVCADKVPDRATRDAIEKELSDVYFEHMTIYFSTPEDQQVWRARDFLNKKIIEISNNDILFQIAQQMRFEFSEEDKITLVDVKQRINLAFNLAFTKEKTQMPSPQ